MERVKLGNERGTDTGNERGREECRGSEGKREREREKQLCRPQGGRDRVKEWLRLEEREKGRERERERKEE